MLFGNSKISDNQTISDPCGKTRLEIRKTSHGHLLTFPNIEAATVKLSQIVTGPREHKV